MHMHFYICVFITVIIPVYKNVVVLSIYKYFYVCIEFLNILNEFQILTWGDFCVNSLIGTCN